jgi:hypothetical protein
MKCDIKAFSKLKEISHYDSWYKDTLATLRAQGVDIVLDPDYSPDPNSYEETVEWEGIQAFAYAMLRYAIRPMELREFVDAHSETSDAQQVFILMTDHVRHSTYADITTRDMLQQIITTRLDFKTWSKSSYEFVVTFNQMFELYNKQQGSDFMRINQAMMRTYMQNALSGIKTFQEISDRETDRMIMGGPPFNYKEYMTAVKSAASKMDVARRKRNSRDINLAMHGDLEDEEPGPTNKEYEINEAKRKFRNPSDYASQMNKETWTSLSKETQEIWDKIGKEDKAKLLNYGMDRAERARKANVHELEDKKEIKVNNHELSEPDVASEEKVEDAPSENPTINVNNVLTGVRSEAHPGDPRRMLGSSKPSTKSSLEAMYHRLGTSYDSEESDSSSSDEDSETGEDFREGGW